MSKLMLDPAMVGQLKSMKAPILLCDVSGHVLGRVVPASVYDDLMVPYTEEELRDAEEEAAEFTLAEIMADMEKR